MEQLLNTPESRQIAITNVWECSWWIRRVIDGQCTRHQCDVTVIHYNKSRGRSAVYSHSRPCNQMLVVKLTKAIPDGRGTAISAGPIRPYQTWSSHSCNHGTKYVHTYLLTTIQTAQPAPDCWRLELAAHTLIKLTKSTQPLRDNSLYTVRGRLKQISKQHLRENNQVLCHMAVSQNKKYKFNCFFSLISRYFLHTHTLCANS